jgi:hypothetical protein
MISENVVILTKAEFHKRIMDAYQRGIERGIREATTPQGCHAGSDGDCSWLLCPQNKDGEPEKSGRHCPLDIDRNEGLPTAADVRGILADGQTLKTEG